MLEMTNMNDSQDKQIAKALEDGDIYRFREIINSAAPVNADDIILQICTKNSLKVRKNCMYSNTLKGFIVLASIKFTCIEHQFHKTIN